MTIPADLKIKLRQILIEMMPKENYSGSAYSCAGEVLERAYPIIVQDTIKQVLAICRSQESEPWYGKKGKWIDGFNDTKEICASAIEREFNGCR